MAASSWTDWTGRLRALWTRVPLRLRIAALLLAGMIGLQCASLWWILAERADALRRVAVVQQMQRAADLVQVFDALPPQARAAALRSLRYPVLNLAPPAAAGPDEGGVQAVADAVWQQRFAARPVQAASTRGALRRVRMGLGQQGLLVSLHTALADGAPLAIELEIPQSGLIDRSLLWPLLGSGALLLALVLLVVPWALRPLDRLAAGADAIGARIDTPPLPETGPPEVRQAAQALNRMQARLRDFVGGRVQALAAMSHDLRTPVTRLRLRAELLDDPAQREAFTRNLAELESMVQNTLDYLSGQVRPLRLGPVDLDGLLARAVEEVEVLGAAVPVTGPSRITVLGEPAELRRALVNLLRNAVVHGCEPSIEVERADAQALIHVLDRGPGIAAEELGRVTAPFYRIEASRNRDTGGAGLGLAIASEIARSHGGELRLAARAGGGLRATLVLKAYTA